MRVYYRLVTKELRVLEVDVADHKEAIQLVVDHFKLPKARTVLASIPTDLSNTNQEGITT